MGEKLFPEIHLPLLFSQHVQAYGRLLSTSTIVFTKSKPPEKRKTVITKNTRNVTAQGCEPKGKRPPSCVGLDTTGTRKAIPGNK